MKYTKFAGLFVVVVVLFLSTYVTFFSPRRGGLELDAERQEAATGAVEASVPPEMRSLRTLYRTINLVQKRYIDATRIDSRAMFVAAMRAVQGSVAKVLVHEQDDELSMRLDNGEQRYALADITTPWILLQKLKEVFGFLEAGLKQEDVDFKEVEYAAINGMLQTLDPHSIFLDPDHYRDMKDKTQGKFGGLGVVISIRDGVLTIISPVKGTPADKAGLKAGDQIVKIGEASTVNMSLNDAVTLLRGKPGTSVTVHVLRKEWGEPRAISIVRAIVKVESVESHLLSGRIGYVRIKDFQGNTSQDIGERLTGFAAKGVRGLVLDLRDCPGGLLEASIEVSDLFLKSGVIVTTAGQGPADRDIRRAKESGGEPSYPLVVLVNRGSASASEILAGALKNHGRALLIGERTFGKGSVQILYDFHDGSALKLTTAQYLTPGDVSIQSVGVVPHVELQPLRADEDMLDLKKETGYRESDLNHHFERSRTTETAIKPVRRLAFLKEPPKKIGKDKDENGDAPPPPLDVEEKFKPDFTIELARDLVAKMTSLEKEKVNTEALFATLEEKAKAEEQKLVNALKKLGVDWRMDGETKSENTQIEAVAQLTAPSPLIAGEESEIKVAVTNNGSDPIHRLLATSKSDFRSLEERELAFGKIMPGETIERRLKFRIPKDALDQVDDVLWSFTSAANQNFKPIALRFSVKALDRPRFAYSYQIVDRDGGNGDSRLQPGESVKLIVDIENVGKGAALDTYTTLKSLSGKELFMISGRDALKRMEPGDKRRVVFTFEVKKEFKEPKARLELGLADVDLRIYVLEKLNLPIASPLAVTPLNQNIAAARQSTPIYAEPSKEALVVAHIAQGATIPAEAQAAEFYRVRLDKERVGWISLGDTSVSGDAVGDAGVKNPAELVASGPPDLQIEKGEQVVRSKTVRIRGNATDETQVRDVYIFVGNDKVFFKPNLNPERTGELAFEAELPLKNGLNYISVVAEETADLYTRQVVVIRRDRSDGMSYLLPTSPNGEPELLGVIPVVNPSVAAEAARASDSRPGGTLPPR
ncbi:MAG: PDZ domain-containing protein [Deltaproteobacteria bacterium]|nr:PDZ domain-containing protein [Deltaproteobacteria bacterium]